MPTTAPHPAPSRAIWDVYCRVVDNHGDVGVCWRLAADLASRGRTVRLWIDDARALAWMAPQGRAGVTVHPWPDTEAVLPLLEAEPAEVVIEAFGCGLPEVALQAMARAQQRSAAPVWINLEYLSAEPYVERSHRLPSLQGSGTARGLTCWYFYPGFTPTTGGLLREPDLLQRQADFSPAAWLADHGIDVRPGERRVSLFCYANPHLPALLHALSAQPTLLLTTPGHATKQVRRLLAAHSTPRHLRCLALPWLTQPDYDHLLWSCELNLVRGEDSLVRALWAERPFLWQIYPQHDGAQAPKLEAFLERSLASAEPTLAGLVRQAARQWNSLHSKAGDTFAPLLNASGQTAAWAAQCTAWRSSLLEQADLVTQLLGFVAEKSAGHAPHPQAKI